MRIPLPRLLRKLRDQQFEAGQVPPLFRYGLRWWARLARWPALYRLATGAGVATLGRLGRRKGRFRKMPFAGGWTNARDLPAPQGRTFQQWWSAEKGVRQ